MARSSSAVSPWTWQVLAKVPVRSHVRGIGHYLFSFCFSPIVFHTSLNRAFPCSGAANSWTILFSKRYRRRPSTKSFKRISGGTPRAPLRALDRSPVGSLLGDDYTSCFFSHLFLSCRVDVVGHAAPLRIVYLCRQGFFTVFSRISNLVFMIILWPRQFLSLSRTAFEAPR